LAVGRLVEKPADIQATVDAFLARPTIPISDVLITAYDFLTDSGTLIPDTVGGWGLTPDTPINETWTVTDLDTAWTSYPLGRDLVSVNAHFEPWRALPAFPSSGYTSADLFYNFHVTGSPYVTDSLTYSMGCHGGLNMPDDDVLTPYNGYEVNPDFPQALAQKGGCMVANTGYGYGVDDSPEYTEWLMVLFTRFLARQDTMPVGEALRLAKQHYLGTAPSGGVSIYHYKVLLEATLYGLPMLQVDAPGKGLAIRDQAASATFGAPQSGGPSAAAINFTVETVPLSPTLHSTVDGQYYTINGEIQASPGRPIQPKTSLSITPLSRMSPHGAVLSQATFVDTSDFDPVITRPVTDVRLAEPDFRIEGWFPAKPWAVNRFGEGPQLVLVGGQFKDEDLTNTVATGTERIYTNMTLLVYHSDLNDYLPPPFGKPGPFPSATAYRLLSKPRMTPGSMRHSSPISY
jgi:hypothetical protein